ncbi:MAG: hypothetical protein Q8O72_08555 [Bacteroidales bacterium]|nr:hypothetical protein [Bacteroidales bacterium]
MNGNVQQKSLSGSFLTNLTLARVFEVLLLLMAGTLAIVLHERLRTPLNIPGHHGLEFMAILLGARLSSKLKWASSISALGIGVFILFPVLGFKDPMMGFNYMLPCFVLDLAYNSVGQLSKYKKLLLVVAAGFGYMMIPLSRLLTTLVTGYPYASFMKHGFLMPVVLFMVFGLMGGLLGTGIYQVAKKGLSKF